MNIIATISTFGLTTYIVRQASKEKEENLDFFQAKVFTLRFIINCVFTLGIFGALTVSNNISSLAVIVSALGFMQWLFSVGISANLKDVEFDSKLGIKTTPTIFGVYESDKKLIINSNHDNYNKLLKKYRA